MSQQLQSGCCCGPDEPPEVCPVPPCPECAPDVYLFSASGNGTVLLNGQLHTWSFEPRGSLRTVRYPQPVTGNCAFGYGGGGTGNNYDLIISGPSSLAGAYVVSGSGIFSTVFACDYDIVQDLRRSVLYVRGAPAGFGARPFLSINGFGPYQQCPPGFVPTELEGGVFWTASVLVEQNVVNSLEFSFI